MNKVNFTRSKSGLICIILLTFALSACGITRAPGLSVNFPTRQIKIKFHRSPYQKYIRDMDFLLQHKRFGHEYN